MKILLYTCTYKTCQTGNVLIYSYTEKNGAILTALDSNWK